MFGSGHRNKDIKRLKTTEHFKSLLDLKLIDTAPRIYEFSPNGLRFLKPAKLTIRFQNAKPNCERFILHGSYNDRCQKTVWELVEIKAAKKLAIINITSFSLYTYVIACCPTSISRMLSHINSEFTCYAYVYYRRSKETTDILVVILSMFVINEKNKEEIKQLNDHMLQGYIQGGKGTSFKTVDTERNLEMCLVCTEVESTCFNWILLNLWFSVTL